MKGLLSALIAVALVAAGLAPPAQAASTQLIIGQIQFLTNMHPMIQVNNTKRSVLSYGQRLVTAFDRNGNNVCILCETVPTLENGLAKTVDKPDGTKGKAIAIVEGVIPEAQKRDAWMTIQRIASEDLPILPMYFYTNSYIVPKDLTDFDLATLDPEQNWSELWRRP